MRSLIKKIDKLQSRYIKIKYPILIKKSIDNDSDSFFFEKKNWNKLIKSYWQGWDASDDGNKIWLNNFFKDFKKIEALNEFNRKGIFNQYRDILDLGAGPLYASFALEYLNPSIKVIAADYGDEIIKICKSIELINHIPYFKVDVLRSDEKIPEADLTMLINFEYHFDDNQLKNIFLKIYENNSDLLIISHTIATPIRYIKSIIARRNIRNNGLRYHGYERSEKLLLEIAKETGYESLEIINHCDYTAFLFNKKYT